VSQASYLYPESGKSGVTIAQKLQLNEYQQNKLNNDLVHAIKPIETDKNKKTSSDMKLQKRKGSATPSAESQSKIGASHLSQ